MTDDLISRQAVINAIDKWVKNRHILMTLPPNEVTPLFESVHELPPVNPQEPKTIQEKQAESEKYQKAFDDGYENGYAQARFDYEQEPKIGHWIEGKCDQCGGHAPFWSMATTYYASEYYPDCGAKMIEPQESEVEE